MPIDRFLSSSIATVFTSVSFFLAIRASQNLITPFRLDAVANRRSSINLTDVIEPMPLFPTGVDEVREDDCFFLLAEPSPSLCGRYGPITLRMCERTSTSTRRDRVEGGVRRPVLSSLSDGGGEEIVITTCCLEQCARVSHTSALPSRPPDSTKLSPSGCVSTERTVMSCPSSLCFAHSLCVSNMHTARSADAVTTSVSSTVQHRSNTLCVCAFSTSYMVLCIFSWSGTSVSTNTRRPLSVPAASQWPCWAVLPNLAVMTDVSSGHMTTERLSFVCSLSSKVEESTLAKVGTPTSCWKALAALA
mmetsp:Transcript_35581/g.92772  ORF Transcript_35581/g.92772 Transcript_35581/m.92772 type:complete len:304 (+) Transcript_35581:1046-1957(+)